MSASPKGAIWRLRNSLWMLFTFTFVFNWIGFFIIGRKARYKKWSIYGALYTIPFILLCVFGEQYDTNSWQWDLIGYSMLGGGIASIIHAFRIRKEYFYRLEAIEMRQPEEERRLRGQIQKEYGVGYSQNPVQQTTNNINTGVPKQQTVTAPSLEKSHHQSKSAVVKNSPVDDAVPVDLNRATEFEIAILPGVGPILAKKAIKERETLGGFQSLEDFAEILGLKPHIVEKIRPLVMVNGPREPRSKHYAGRMVDF
ncbi:ComEA family DNA-binding protein [Neobacillus dielmonensis]|uniref:ComEA family DNA-binding protein n=1 Tax=Neobacillus dielmonensis TaxID=1347369 RepID=UPI000693FF9D|nr:helix-hairpin-helix domain-containing protein [Neobacillus dielmonensis]